MTGPCLPDTLESLHRSLLSEYGPLLGDETLWRALGFKTWAGFDKAIRTGNVAVKIFPLPGRRGRYALTRDVAVWLWEARETGMHTLFQQEPR